MRPKFQSELRKYLMPLNAPTQFGEAIDDLVGKGVLPTNLTSAQIRQLDNGIKRVSFFSAQTTSADLLTKYKTFVDGIIQGQTRTSADQDVAVGINPSKARAEIKKFLKENGYQSPAGKEGTIEDLSSDQRVNLVVKTNVQMAQGAGRYAKGNSPASVAASPGWELVRIAHAKGGPDAERDWPKRFSDAADESGDEVAAKVLEDTGRMISLKSSDLWQSLGDGAGGYDDTLGNPYAPFAFQSHMIQRPVSREEMEELGFLDADEEPEASDMGVGELFSAAADYLETQVADSIVGAFVGTVANRIRNTFDPDQQRDADGKFSAAGAVAARHGMTPIHREGTLWKQSSREDLPEHAAALGIPPAWSNAHINPDKNADLQAVGEDAKGRVQRIYSDAFVQKQADAKFSRNTELLEKQHHIFAQNEANLKSDDAKTRENAATMKLIQQTGIRPGSDRDTVAEKQAYGATTLEGRHVIQDSKGNVSLQFVGKKGVDLNIPVEDKSTAQMLLDRKNSSGENGKLFKTDDASLRDYSHTLDGGSFKPKDFRTLKGTQTAIDEIKKQPQRASTLKEYKQRVMDVAKKVASKLGNTPTIALQSYINPSVFSQWKPE